MITKKRFERHKEAYISKWTSEPIRKKPSQKEKKKLFESFKSTTSVGSAVLRNNNKTFSMIMSLCYFQNVTFKSYWYTANIPFNLDPFAIFKEKGISYLLGKSLRNLNKLTHVWGICSYDVCQEIDFCSILSLAVLKIYVFLWCYTAYNVPTPNGPHNKLDIITKRPT